ncbi:hypothetical protein U9M73_00320 [Paenibacillus phoenicis]|jgi:hypothetical protein|uniref:Uncharacterized protein n=1 Tax=Paenibacillus phoenicis TaxID=554117 RepID=A0ABU5PEX4_9BACL|nr:MULTISPECIES: hypothetical protein [Paenibacillus]EES73622.1 hypothetical protein POTG_01917 [Paenibacillus sp. oral taxon 786 str. D14]MCT2193635.1 hypothetical protein [Paenibacillus sp. p3-SID1389]MEA3568443.1 hypothetical protein [Paenibacillus phoenicis]MEC2346706.1 hypothetical protein [Paenibacillus barengoltzii]
MNKRGTGTILIVIAAMLFIFRNSTHLLVAAIMGQKNGNFAEGTFSNAMGATFSYSMIPEIIALIAGLIYLIWAEIQKEK